MLVRTDTITWMHRLTQAALYVFGPCNREPQFSLVSANLDPTHTAPPGKHAAEVIGKGELQQGKLPSQRRTRTKTSTTQGNLNSPEQETSAPHGSKRCSCHYTDPYSEKPLAIHLS